MKSEQKYAKIMEDGYQSLLAVEGIDEKKADSFYDKDITSAKELAETEVENLVSLEINGIDLDTATELVVAAKIAVEKIESEKHFNKKHSFI